MLSSHTICSFLYLISLTTAAQISPSKSGTTYRTLALPSILVRPADNAQYYCTTSPSWVNATWNPADCLGANQLVQDVELVPRRNTVYEFIEAGARQLSPTFYGQATPRKYIYGSCTLSVVMMNDTKIDTYRKLIPPMAETMSGRKPTFTKTDFTTYQDIWYAFQQIYRLCAQEYGVPGWIEIGNDLSVGIFLHATNSIVDQSINGTEPNTTIARTLPTDWAYLGCNHGTTYSDVFVKIWGGDGLSLGRCAEYCTGEEYFGVKNGSECYCGGTNFTAYAAVGGEMACNTTCNGNASEVCGGVNSLSMYQHWPGKAYIPTWGVNNG